MEILIYWHPIDMLWKSFIKIDTHCDTITANTEVELTEKITSEILKYTNNGRFKQQ